MKFAYHLAACLMLLLSVTLSAQEEGRLLRFPHMQGNKIAFVHGGDIWVCTKDNLNARRLTSYNEGFEVMPRISPDGNWVAFSGEYSGSRQIYVVPFAGGVPKQVTFYPDVGPMPPRGGFDNLPYDWTSDSKKILVRSNRTPYGQRVGRYFLVDREGKGMPQALAVPEGGSVSISPDGKRLAYNLISREWRTWKRYVAGRAQDVHIFDLDAMTSTRITTYEGTDSHPLWLGNKIYFTSDRTGTLNLWCHDLDTKREYAVTKSESFDVLFPSRGQGGIVFEQGGYIGHMDAKTEEVTRLKIRLADDKPWTRSIWKEGETRVGGFALSPEAKRVVVEFRGELFTAPAKNGEVRPLMSTLSRRERSPGWSPDGRYISYLAECGDNYEIVLFDRKSKTERQLTKGSEAWILDYKFSPDGSHIAYTDKAANLQVVRVEDGQKVSLDNAGESGIQQFKWAFDSKHLTYDKTGRNGLTSIWVVSVDEKKPRRVTNHRFADSSPTFDPNGKFLYFVSARDFDYGELSFERRIYALSLTKGGPSPMPHKSDEAAVPGIKEEEKEENGEAKIVIDYDNIEDRVTVLPLSSGNYGGLNATKSGLLYLSSGGVQRFDFGKAKSSQILKGVRTYTLTADHKKMAYRHRGGIAIDSVSPGRKAGANPVPLAGVRVKINPLVEWQQMFQDAWRITRDWFYDPKLHRVDWQGMKKKYEPLLAHMSHRSDLDYILGELIGELNVGHAYVQSGESPSVKRVSTGCLGAEFAVENGRYRIMKLFSSENWTRDGRNPMTEVGVNAKVGDFLLAINGKEVTADDNLFQHLEGTVGQRVRLTLADSAAGAAKHDEFVKPIGSEVRLRYLDWVENNRKLVESMSNGRIGYIHVPNTAVEGHRRFYEGMYALAQEKEALIIDDRYNGGGFIPDGMAYDLLKKPLNYWSRRSVALSSTPSRAFAGPSVMLINGYSSSGGDAFPYYYKKLGIGKLLGTRTWGGLVGISFEPGLVDGGRIKVPSFAFVNTDGEWAVEAEGVAPDIEVFDDPGRIARGEEVMLIAGIKHLMEQLKDGKKNVRPPVPDGPKRN